MEIRSLVNLITPTGSMQVEWVRSHQESIHTDDIALRRKREALAVADAAAKASHAYRMQGTYTEWLHLDCWIMLDLEGRLVLGSALAHIRARQASALRLQWLTTQESKAEYKQVLTSDEQTMVWRYGWSMTLSRFYWRTRFGLLHTNSVKHQFDPR
jgi:hypothetical protein